MVEPQKEEHLKPSLHDVSNEDLRKSIGEDFGVKKSDRMSVDETPKSKQSRVRDEKKPEERKRD